MSRISLTTHTLPKIEFCQVTTLFVPVDRSLKQWLKIIKNVSFHKVFKYLNFSVKLLKSTPDDIGAKNQIVKN